MRSGLTKLSNMSKLKVIPLWASLDQKREIDIKKRFILALCCSCFQSCTNIILVIVNTFSRFCYFNQNHSDILEFWDQLWLNWSQIKHHHQFDKHLVLTTHNKYIQEVHFFNKTREDIINWFKLVKQIKQAFGDHIFTRIFHHVCNGYHRCSVVR